MTAFIVIVSIVAYILVGGVFGGYFHAGRYKRCEECRRTRAGEMSKRYRSLRADCNNEHGAIAMMLGAAWPVSWLIIVGQQIGVYLAEGDDRKEAQRVQERKEYEEARRIIASAGIEWPEMPGS